MVDGAQTARWVIGQRERHVQAVTCVRCEGVAAAAAEVGPHAMRF